MNLQVFLRGERNYVQASQILARTGEHVDYVFGSGAALRECSFRRLTRQMVAAQFTADRTLVVPNAIGQALFDVPGGSLKVHYFETEMPAPRQATPDRASVHFVDPKDQPDVLLFDGADCFGEALAAIVQALKKYHANCYPDADDLWFTGLRQAELRADRGLPSSSGRIHVETLRLMGAPPQFQTLNRVSIAAGGVCLAAIHCTFAFRLRA